MIVLHICVIFIAVLSVQLTALAVFGYHTGLYKSYLLPESPSNISQHDSGTAISTFHCAYGCTQREECNEFTYHRRTKICSYKSCVNPNLYPEGQGDDFGFYIRDDVVDRFSKLLARRELILLTFT